MFIQTEATPNPSTLKFIPGRNVYDGTLEFNNRGAADFSPFGQSLFNIEGVKSIMFGPDFIAITKVSNVEWHHLKPEVLGAIMDGFVSNMPIFIGQKEDIKDNPKYEGEAAQIVSEIEDLLLTRVRPAVAQDGGDIEFDSFDIDTGVVYLRMRGACSGCPSSAITLKNGVENMIKHYVPEVSRVEQVF
jgi:NFU1 iron-sulfur cluster scaffold homolog, mitochondrial